MGKRCAKKLLIACYVVRFLGKFVVRFFVLLLLDFHLYLFVVLEKLKKSNDKGFVVQLDCAADRLLGINRLLNGVEMNEDSVKLDF